ncbi:MAG: hypothetical protein WAW85_03185 [Gordonia sp. (in: high G+C Gram-positive bacteria)]|uniref:hypothetical protein n=1 Tax=Gordonia sp. (in: high G+C Gram-positive bacteria) TaxID=84139 RepID=UPI003BB73E82
MDASTTASATSRGRIFFTPTILAPPRPALRSSHARCEARRTNRAKLELATRLGADRPLLAGADTAAKILAEQGEVHGEWTTYPLADVPAGRRTRWPMYPLADFGRAMDDLRADRVLGRTILPPLTG